MRFIRVVTALAFALVVGLSVFLHFKIQKDTTAPKIEISTDNIVESCNVSTKKLLTYVHASDNKDGDLTDKVFVEGISQFIEEGVSRVTFCVSDSDGNVAKKSCELTFKDYKKPKLILNDDLVFFGNEVVNVSGCAAVDDCFDKDEKSQRLSVIAQNYSTSTGTVPVKFKFTNSKGSTYEWNIDALVFSNETRNPHYETKLKKYLLTLEKGSKKPDFRSYFDSALLDGEKIEAPSVEVDSSAVNLKKAGQYSVWFNLYDNLDGERTLVCKKRLIVICEDDKQ